MTTAPEKPETEQTEPVNLNAIRVHENVLSVIVRKAVLSVEGVLRLSDVGVIDSLAELVGARKMFDRSILIEMGENSVTRIEIRIVTEDGYYIPAVAKALQLQVLGEVEEMAGMTVDALDVTVTGVEARPVEAAEAEEEAADHADSEE